MVLLFIPNGPSKNILQKYDEILGKLFKNWKAWIIQQIILNGLII